MLIVFSQRDVLLSDALSAARSLPYMEQRVEALSESCDLLAAMVVTLQRQVRELQRQEEE